MGKYLNLSTDTTLGGDNPSDILASSQKAIKTYIDYNEDGVYSGREEEVIEKPVEENTSKEESDSNGQ